jgi:type VI secretion system protein ImpE
VLRAQVLREGRPPKFQGDDATPAQRAALKARMLVRLGDAAGAAQAAEEVETLRARTPGHLVNADGSEVPFEDLRDADDLWAAELEVLTAAGDHILVPVERLRSLAFDAPRRPRDLVWRRCSIDLKDGTEGVVYVPALYLGPQRETENALLLGRATEWTDPAQGPVRGRGLRMMLVGEELLSIMALNSVVFD